MSATVTIDPDGVVRIEIVLRLDIVLRTEEVARAAGVRVRDDGDEHHGVHGRHEPGRGDRLADDRGPDPERGGGHSADGPDIREDEASGEPAVDAVAVGSHAQAPDGVEADPLPSLPPADEEPQPAAEAGGQPTLAEAAGAAAPAKRAKRPARKSGAVTPDQLSRREIAIAAYQRGATFFEAGREARVSHVTVGNWVRDAGIPVRLGAWKLPPQYPRTAIPKPAAQAAPKMAAAPEPAHAASPPPGRPAPRPLTGDEAAIAEAVATGRVTRVPDASAFAKLPAIVGINHARSVLEAAGATVRRSGAGWDVDGRKVSNQGLIQAAQAAQRQALLDRSVPA